MQPPGSALPFPYPLPSPSHFPHRKVERLSARKVSRSTDGTKRTALAIPLGLLLHISLFWQSCGVTSAPRYTRAPRSRVVAELEKRQSAGHSRLLRVVDSYLGVPYKWGGTTRRGMDCSAFTRAVFRETYGVELPRTSKQMYRLGQQIGDQSNLHPGDLIFFRDTYAGPGVSHVGIYIGDGRFAHASSSKGGTITPLEATYFRQRYVGARRIRR